MGERIIYDDVALQGVRQSITCGLNHPDKAVENTHTHTLLYASHTLTHTLTLTAPCSLEHPPNASEQGIAIMAPSSIYCVLEM